MKEAGNPLNKDARLAVSQPFGTAVGLRLTPVVIRIALNARFARRCGLSHD